MTVDQIRMTVDQNRMIIDQISETQQLISTVHIHGGEHPTQYTKV